MLVKPVLLAPEHRQFAPVPFKHTHAAKIVRDGNQRIFFIRYHSRGRVDKPILQAHTDFIIFYGKAAHQIPGLVQGLHRVIEIEPGTRDIEAAGTERFVVEQFCPGPIVAQHKQFALDIIDHADRHIDKDQGGLRRGNHLG